jgi:predicted SAM-dependent methyltransferase
MYNTLRGIKGDVKCIGNWLKKVNRGAVIKRYFEINSTIKLHLGSNVSNVEGWLCSDIAPGFNGAIYLDASKRFPFEDSSVDYIYSEHMIEHLSLEESGVMLNECFRVLKDGGKIRLATPNLSKIIDLYQDDNDNSAQGKEYVAWISTMFLGNPKFNRIEVINQMFHGWKHKFLFDEDYLKEALTNKGFKNIKTCEYGLSDDLQLSNLETHHLNVGNLEMVKFETLILEAEK